MTKITNDLLLSRFQTYSREADGVEDKTLDERLSAVEHLVAHSDNLKKLSPAKAKSFKSYLKEITVNGKKLSLKRQRRILGYVREFLTWLSLQPAYKTSIPIDLISYYSLSNKENRLANISKRRDFPTLNQVLILCERIK
jgi:hypothetical protein